MSDNSAVFDLFSLRSSFNSWADWLEASDLFLSKSCSIAFFSCSISKFSALDLLTSSFLACNSASSEVITSKSFTGWPHVGQTPLGNFEYFLYWFSIDLSSPSNVLYLLVDSLKSWINFINLVSFLRTYCSNIVLCSCCFSAINIDNLARSSFKNCSFFFNSDSSLLISCKSAGVASSIVWSSCIAFSNCFSYTLYLDLFATFSSSADLRLVFNSNNLLSSLSLIVWIMKSDLVNLSSLSFLILGVPSVNLLGKPWPKIITFDKNIEVMSGR